MDASRTPTADARGIRARLAIPGATALVFLGTFALLASSSDRLLGDPDTLWHVAIGGRIAETRAVPWTDAYSHTFAGAPWIAKEWLGQVLLAAAHALGGWAGVALLAALATAAALALVHDFLARRMAPASALVVTALAGMLCAPHLLARPHVLALPLIVLWTRGLVEAAEAQTAPRWPLALVMALWANVHAGFTIGFALAGLAALDALWSAPPARRRGLAAGWFGFLALTLAAACATPYGHRAMLVTLTLFGSGEPLPYIDEWRPLGLDVVGCVGMGLMALTLGALLARPRANLVRIALVALLCAMAVRHGRFLELFALLAPLVAADPILRLVPGWRGGAAPAPGFAGRVSAVLVAGLIAAAALCQHPVPDPRNAPAAALAAARERGLTVGKVYNDYDFGGFLIASGVPTFIDGRSDQIFLDGFTRALNEAADARADGPFLALLDGRGVTWALVRTGSPEAGHLGRSPRWRAVFADPEARVFALGAP